MVLDWSVQQTVSQAGNDCIKVLFVTEYRSFTVWLTHSTAAQFAYRRWEAFSRAIYHGHVAPDCATLMQYMDRAKMPETVTYRRKKDSKFYDVLGYNAPADKPA
jgi:hypothetical protein